MRSLKLRELKTQTQISLSASFPDEEDCIGEIKFNNSGALAFKACIEKTFSSKHKYLLFHFNTEKSHLMISKKINFDILNLSKQMMRLKKEKLSNMILFA